jgi:hypothetical protein
MLLCGGLLLETGNAVLRHGGLARMAQSNNDSETGKQQEFGTVLSCILGICVWVFISSDPSPTAWILALLLLTYLILGYCLLMIHLSELEQGAPVPVRAHQPPPLQLDITDA